MKTLFSAVYKFLILAGLALLIAEVVHLDDNLNANLERMNACCISE